MNLKIRRLGALLLTPLLLFMATGCPTTTTSQNVYRIAEQSDVRSLDPLKLGDVQSVSVGYNVYNALVNYRPQITGPGQKLTDLVPDLAESWTTSPDGKTFRFKLRPGVKFHTGRVLTAEDIKYSIERLLNPDNASNGLWTGDALKLVGLVKYQESVKKKVPNAHIDGVKVVDPLTIEITMERPIPFALHLLAMPYYYVVPKEEVEHWGKDYSSHPVGTGAFKFAEWQRGQYIRLVRNPDYFETGQPYLDEIRYLIVPEESQRLLRFENGELEQSTIPPSAFERIINDTKWNPMGAEALLKAPEVTDPGKSHIIKTPRLIVNYLGLDNKAEPFNDVRVRQAFNYGIDRDRIVDKILNKRGIVARGVLPQGFPGYKSNRQLIYNHDLNKARTLLQQAGWKEEGGILKKGGQPFKVTLWYNSGPEVWQKTMASVQADLKKLGIEVEIRALEWSSYLDKLDRGEATFFRLGWQADYPDPDNFLWTLLHSRNIKTKENRAKYSNPQVDRLLDLAQVTMDWKAREPLYWKAEDLIVQDAPWVFLFQPVEYEIMQPYVKNQQLHPLIPNVLKIVKLERS